MLNVISHPPVALVTIIHRIRRFRKKNGIRCKQVKKFKATTNWAHPLPVAENLLKQKFEALAPNEIWMSDITYIPTDEGWLYCAAHKDLFHGDIVRYALGARMTKSLVARSLARAAAVKHPPKGLIHHSDRGSQYCSPKYRKLLTLLGMVASMSRKGNCYDNAPMESFWGTPPRISWSLRMLLPSFLQYPRARNTECDLLLTGFAFCHRKCRQ
ncbi:MAG TPA: IS3 family transposase [Deltaproteobacteria bacterium]|nr:IS3 family transposase [Deltaproteobacteria bacterium]